MNLDYSENLMEEKIHGQDTERSAGVHARQDGLGSYGCLPMACQMLPRKGRVRVIDDEHLVFADLFSRKTRENLLKNPKVAVTVIDEKSYRGYQIKGAAELLTAGELFEQMAEELKKAPMKLPPATYVVKITVEAVFDQSVGPEAGKQIV